MTHHTPLSYQPCRIPLRRATGVFGGISITVHAGIYNDVLEADRLWRLNGGDALWDVRQSDTGSYNCRNSVGHSRAVAIDFNWSTNGMTSKRTPCPGDMPAAFYELCWEPLGYGWGANWRSSCDRMHISKLVSEGGDGVLWRTWDQEEDEMTPEDWTKMQAIIHQEVGMLAAALLSKDDDKAQAGGSHFEVPRGDSLMDVAVAARNNSRKAMENTATPPAPPAAPVDSADPVPPADG